jgi:hypothetical protein
MGGPAMGTLAASGDTLAPMRTSIARGMGLLALAATVAAQEPALQPLAYNNPGLVVDLGVGLGSDAALRDAVLCRRAGNGVPDFVGGAEDDRFYYLRNPRR